MLLPYANTQTMMVHLEHISRQIPTEKHAVIVLDRAGWHTTKHLNHFENITLLPLPAASPELNPCEQIWKLLRRTHLSNRSFKDEKDLLIACSNAWCDFAKNASLISSLCSREWAKL